MKKRFLVLFSMMFVFGLFATAFALSGTDAKVENAVSCPMQQTQTTVTADNIDMSKVIVSGDGDSCCQPGADCCKGGSCCKDKDSCPMKKSPGSETTKITDISKVIVVSDGDSCCHPGADCCKGGACCRKKS